MLKKTVTFEDFNGDMQTDTLYFNLTKTEMMDLLDLQPRLEAWQNLEADKLTQKDTIEFFDLIKELIRASYGVRSEDGKHFRKSPELYLDFESSAMYDAFTFDFITHPEKALEFMIGILPKGIDDAAIQQAQGALAEFQKNAGTEQVVELPQPVISEAVDMDQRPAWVKEDREPTKAELSTMTPDQLQEAFRRRLTAK